MRDSMSTRYESLSPNVEDRQGGGESIGAFQRSVVKMESTHLRKGIIFSHENAHTLHGHLEAMSFRTTQRKDRMSPPES